MLALQTPPLFFTMPKIFFTGDGMEEKVLTDKHKEVTIDKDTNLAGDAFITALIIQGDNTKVCLNKGLRVGEVIYGHRTSSSNNPNNPVLELRGANVDTIRNFGKVKLSADSTVHTIKDTDAVVCCGASNVNNIFAKKVFMFNRSKATTVEAQEIRLKDDSIINDSITFSKPNGRSVLPVLEVCNRAKFSGALNLNGHSKYCFYINGGQATVQNSAPAQKTASAAAKAQGASAPQTADSEGFAGVAGNTKLKEELTRFVIKPVKDPRYQEMGVKMPNGILFFGPPGNGKTHMAKALAKETGRNFVEIKLSDIGSEFINKTAANLKKKMDEAVKQKPVVIFMDEIDSIAPSRADSSSGHNETTKVVNELLIAANNCADNDVLIIYATNTPEVLDAALKRSGRIDHRFEIKNPDFETRVELLKMYAGQYKNVDEAINYETLAEQSEGLISSDFVTLANYAAIMAVEDDSSINQTHILKAIEKSKQDKEGRRVIRGFAFA